jgi:hypothetical protein
MAGTILALNQTKPTRLTKSVNRISFQLVSGYKFTVSKKVVIPAKAGIQFFQGFMDAGSGPA